VVIMRLSFVLVLLLVSAASARKGILGNLVGGVVHAAGDVVEGAANVAGHVVGGAAHVVGGVVGGAAHVVGGVVGGAAHLVGGIFGEGLRAAGGVVSMAAHFHNCIIHDCSEPLPEGCPTGFTAVGNNCYWADGNADLTHADAVQTCLNIGAQPIMIETEAELQRVHDWLVSIGFGKSNFWTSGRRTGSRGKDPASWTWLNGKMTSPALWAPNNPDGHGDAVQMWAGQRHRLDDVQGDTRRGLLCELTYIAGFAVTYGGETAPDGHLPENINEGYGGSTVWLAPLTTNNRAQAARGFKFWRQYIFGAKNIPNLSKGAGGPFRYIKALYKGDHVVTSVYLSEHRGNQCTTDINKGRKGRYLYLCWTLDKHF